MSIYLTLPLANGDTRLVSVEPQDPRYPDNLVCHLEVTNLTTPYLTLSYTWGPASPEDAARGVTDSPSCPISCNGREILVAANLKAALCRIRDHPLFSTKKFWIDAICIDQTNIHERSEQVCLMAKIYTSAETVVIWLGDEDAHTQKAFGLVESLSLATAEALRVATTNTVVQGSMARISGQHSESSPMKSLVFWEAARCLFRRKYFSRVWVIQEVVLARKATVLCGSYTTSWEYFETFSHFVSTTAWGRYFTTASQKEPIWGPCYHNVPTVLKASRKSRENGNYAEVLVQALVRSRSFHSRDPRDKIYGLLGLLGSRDVLRDKPRLQPVYGERTVEAVYTDAAIQILQDSDDLLLLYCVEGPKFQYSQGLPSWVPDWRCEQPLGLRVTGYARFNACGGLPRQLVIHDETNILELQGLRIDDVDVVAETKHEINAGERFPKLLRIIQDQHNRAGEEGLNAVWRALITDTGGDPPLCPVDSRFRGAFIAWLVGKLQAFSIPDEDSHDELLEEFEELKRVGSSSFGKDDYETVFSHALHLRPFSTSESLIGLGSECLARGDSIWIVRGSRVPLIFRDVGSDTHQLIGGAYVHGIMNGEAVKLYGSAGVSWQTLFIR